MARSGPGLKVDPIIDKLFLDVEKGNNDSVITVLQEKGIDSYDRYKRTVLINSAFYGNIDLLEWCIKNGADINFQDSNGMSALHFAAKEGRLDVAKILIKKGIKIDLQDLYGKDALSTALLNWKGGANLEMVKVLLESGADPRVKNKSGISAYEVMGEKLRKELGLE